MIEKELKRRYIIRIIIGILPFVLLFLWVFYIVFWEECSGFICFPRDIETYFWFVLASGIIFSPILISGLILIIVSIIKLIKIKRLSEK